MSFLRKLLGKAPEWASMYSGAEFKLFIDAVRAELAAAGIPYRLDTDKGIIQARMTDAPDVHSLGLLNLAQGCRGHDQSAWPELIRKHLRIMAETPQRNSQIDDLGADFTKAREFLKVRLHPEGYAADLNAVCSEPIAEGLIAVLVYDFPESIATVHPNHVERWRVPMHDLIQVGLRNVRALGRLEPERLELRDDVWMDAYEDGGNYFAASHALMLHEYFDPEPDLGLLVGVPTRHGMMVRAIDGPEALQALNAMFYVMPVLHDQGPGSVTKDVYWYRAGTLTKLPYEMKGDTVQFFAPEAFADQVLRPLGQVGAETSGGR